MIHHHHNVQNFITLKLQITVMHKSRLGKRKYPLQHENVDTREASRETTLKRTPTYLVSDSNLTKQRLNGILE